MYEFNEKLKKLLLTNDWSVNDFCKSSGVTKTLINSYLNNTKELTKDYYEILEDILRKLDTKELAPKRPKRNKNNPKRLKFNQPVVISYAIHKGGSGKTSVAVNTAYELSTIGYKVLLIDTDAQCNSAMSVLSDFMNREDVLEKNFYRAYLNEISLKESIIHTDYENLDVVCGSPELAQIEFIISRIVNRIEDSKDIFKNCIAEVIKENYYDFIICDLNPSLGNLNFSILCGSNEIIIPAEVSPFAAYGLKVFVDFFTAVKEINQDINILGVVITKFDKRTPWTIDIINAVDQVFPNLRMKSIVQVDTNIPKSQWCCMPVKVFASNTRCVKEFRSLTLEIISHCKKYSVEM